MNNKTEFLLRNPEFADSIADKIKNDYFKKCDNCGSQLVGEILDDVINDIIKAEGKE